MPCTVPALPRPCPRTAEGRVIAHKDTNRINNRGRLSIMALLLFLPRFLEVKRDGKNFQEGGGERATSVGVRLREYLGSKVVRE
jgi:hypothetical protein